MINWISGITGILWGSGLIIFRMKEVIDGAPLYSKGRIISLLFGMFFLAYGIVFIKRALKNRKN